MPKTIFLDTDTYLHYQYFDQINWLEIVRADAVTILIPPITIRELNKLKDSHPRPRIKKRAGTALKRLNDLFADGSKAQLRDSIVAQLEARDSLIDFQAHQLSREIQDDQLIASIVMYRNESPASEIVLVTSDAGLTLMAKARRHGIPTIRLPDNLRLPEEPDPDQERIRRLEQEIQELKLKVPQLTLTFEDGSQHAKFALPQPIQLTQKEIDNRLAGVKQRYPKMAVPSGQTDKSKKGNVTLADIVAGMDASIFSTVSLSDITKYNAELDKFYEAYAKHLQNEIAFQNLGCRTIKLEIWLANDGTAPAEDIDIFMSFPDGFTLTDEEGFPESPEPPDPPSPSKTTLDNLLGTYRGITSIPYIERFRPPSISIPPSRNVSPPTIKRTNSYDVEIYVERVKHKMREAFDPLYLIFESLDNPRSFQIDYQILAGNVPEMTPGKLHVIVEEEN